MKLDTKKKKKKPVKNTQPIDYVITHKLLNDKGKTILKTLGFKRLREARRVANVMNRNRTFVKLVNKKGVVLCL